MKFRAHDTFYIRKSWLPKGLFHINRDPFVFMGREENPMDVLGMGSNMVKALRYWLQAVGLTEEPKRGARQQTLTELGEIVFEHDPYVEETGTLWLLQYHLATNKKNATAWYYFFNEFSLLEFSKDDFVSNLSKYVTNEGEEYSERSYEDDFACIINTYVPRAKTGSADIDAENIIESPFVELGLLSNNLTNNKVYQKTPPQSGNIPPLVFLACIEKEFQGQNEISITAILNDKKSPGMVFSLDMFSMMDLLNTLELMGMIEVIRTAGLDVIKRKSEENYLMLVSKYYDSLNR